jgi:hypothetical protein
MKKLFLVISFVLFSTQVFSQVKMDENFEYPSGGPGDSIGAHGWVWFSGVANTVLVSTPGLSYAGYPLSGIGNAASLTTNGNDQYKSMTSSADTGNATAVYGSCMANITSAQRPGDYFFAFLPSSSTSFFSGRVSVRLNGGVLEFGLTKASQPDTNTMVWVTGYSLNTTYVIVLKYKFVSGPNNDEVSLYVFPAGLPATEPLPTIGPQSFSTTSGDANNIGRFALRQGMASRGPNVIVDGIIVSLSWPSNVVNVKLAIQGLTSLTRGSQSRRDTTEIYLRNSTLPYAIVDSAVAVIDSLTLRGSYGFPNATVGTSYYYDVLYRHLPIYRNGVETFSKNPQTLGGSAYDFTTSADKAYGDNQIPVGSRFAIYNGDVNQDGIIDLADAAAIDNDLYNFASGYLNTDLDGNESVDITDASIADNNGYNFVGSITPLP